MWPNLRLSPFKILEMEFAIAMIPKQKIFTHYKEFMIGWREWGDKRRTAEYPNGKTPALPSIGGSGLRGGGGSCGKYLGGEGVSVAEWLERQTWVQIPFWPLADAVLGSPKFNFSAALVNSQLVCLPPVGILNSLYYIWVICFNCLLGAVPLALLL